MAQRAGLLAPGEPIRTHWTEILETAERLGAERGSPSLVPTDEDDRMRLFGLAHELLGENSCGRADCSSSTARS